MNEMDVEASIIPWFDTEKKSISEANWLEFTQQTRADVISTPDNEARKETSWRQKSWQMSSPSFSACLSSKLWQEKNESGLTVDRVT